MGISPKHPFIILKQTLHLGNQVSDQLDNGESHGSIATCLELCEVPLDSLLNIYSVFSLHLIQITAKTVVYSLAFHGKRVSLGAYRIRFSGKF